MMNKMTDAIDRAAARKSWPIRKHRLGEEPAVLAEVLRSHGYKTVAFVSSVVLDRVTGIDRGFETYDDTVRIGPREAFDYRERAAAQTNENGRP